MSAAAPAGDAVTADDPITVDGVTYAGVHALCAHNADKAAADYRAALDEARRAGGADAAIGREIRRWLLPGAKRKVFRRDELQRLVDAADRYAARAGGES